MSDTLDILNNLHKNQEANTGDTMFLHYETFHNVHDSVINEMREFRDAGFSIHASYNRRFGTQYTSIFYSVYRGRNEVSFHTMK